MLVNFIVRVSAVSARLLVNFYHRRVCDGKAEIHRTSYPRLPLLGWLGEVHRFKIAHPRRCDWMRCDVIRCDTIRYYVMRCDARDINTLPSIRPRTRALPGVIWR